MSYQHVLCMEKKKKNILGKRKVKYPRICENLNNAEFGQLHMLLFRPHIFRIFGECEEKGSEIEMLHMKNMKNMTLYIPRSEILFSVTEVHHDINSLSSVLVLVKAIKVTKKGLHMRPIVVM